MSGSDKDVPSRDELEQMSTDELVKLGTNLDGVEIIHRAERYTEAGTKVEKRAERQVAVWFTIAGISALACLGIFLFNHWEFALPPDDPNYWWYTFNTPLLGATFGLSVLSIGIAMILITKKFIPSEISVQDRHDGGSAEVDKKTIVGLLQDTGTTSTLGRRKMIIGSAGFGLGAFALTGLVAFLGGFIKNRGPSARTPRCGTRAGRRSTTPRKTPNETIYLRRDTGNPYQVALVRPEDLDAGGMETVFPWRRSNGFGETEHSRHALMESLHEVRNPPVMLIRLRPPEDTARAIKRTGQESFNYGDYFAYTKVCSHLVAPPRCTNSGATASCVPATSRSSTRSSTPSRSSDRRPVLSHSCRSR